MPQANTIAGLLGLDGLLGRRPAALSGGERQRVAIGRALARHPRVLLFDEPFSSLDPPLRAALREEVLDLQRQFGTTLILVTHDQGDAMLMGDRIAILDRGRLLQCDSPRAIYRRPSHRFVATFVGNPPMNILPCEVVREEGRTRIHPIAAEHGLSWTLPGDPLPAGIDEVELGLRPEAIRVWEGGRSADDPASSPTMLAQVRRVEFNGAELLATLTLGPHRLVARLPASQSIHDRQRVHIVLDLDRAAWFDPATGRALNLDGGSSGDLDPGHPMR
jgi:multiple sugar transport system ATP-binding protein